MEHSRSPTAHTVPCWSAITCTSMCRPDGRYGSANTVPSPKAASASARAPASWPSSSAGVRTTRIPRPPPPEEALISSGKSDAVADRLSSAGSSSASTGTPAAAISRFASILDPIRAIACGGGPIHTRPAASTARANPAFSDSRP